MRLKQTIPLLAIGYIVTSTMATPSAIAADKAKLEEVYFHNASFIRTARFASIMAKILKLMNEQPLQPREEVTVYRLTYYMSFETPYILRVEKDNRSHKCRVFIKEYLPIVRGEKEGLVSREQPISIANFEAFENSFLDAQPVENSRSDCDDGGCDIVEMQTPEIYHAVISDGLTSAGMKHLKCAFQKLVPYLPRKRPPLSPGSFESQLAAFKKSNLITTRKYNGSTPDFSIKPQHSTRAHMPSRQYARSNHRK